MAGDLVRSTLAGQKIETRRPMVIGRSLNSDGSAISTWFAIARRYCLVLGKDGSWPKEILQHCPFGVPGDRLWVRECWAAGKCADELAPTLLLAGTWIHSNGGLWYRADDTAPRTPISPRGIWRPSLHMPRWASRLLLDVTNVRVERLQSITEQGAEHEGFRADYPVYTARGFFRDTWESIYGGIDPKNNQPRPYRWDQNPWVWVVSYKVHQ